MWHWVSIKWGSTVTARQMLTVLWGDVYTYTYIKAFMAVKNTKELCEEEIVYI